MQIEAIDIGEAAVCDKCNADFSESDEQGGFLFYGSAYCPLCAPDIRSAAIAYGEQQYITECPPNVSFKDFVLKSRGGNNNIYIQTW